MSSNFSTNFVIDEIVQKVEKLNFRKKSPKNPSRRKRKTLDDDEMANNETQEAKKRKSGNILIQVYQWAEWRGGIRKRTEIGPISPKEAKKIQKTAVKNYFAHKEDENFRENNKQEKIAKWRSTIPDEQKRKNIFHSMKLVMDFPEIEKMLISKDGGDADNFGITFQRSILREGFFITSIAEGRQSEISPLFKRALSQKRSK